MGLFAWLRARTVAEDSPEPGGEAASLDGAVRADWTTLPATPAAVSAIEPVVDRRFDRSLATWQSPLVLRQLDHAVSSDAPAGLVLARAHRDAEARVAEGRNVVQTTTPGPSPGAVVQRVVALDGPRRPAPVVAVPSRSVPVTAIREPAPVEPSPVSAVPPSSPGEPDGPVRPDPYDEMPRPAGSASPPDATAAASLPDGPTLSVQRSGATEAVADGPTDVPGVRPAESLGDGSGDRAPLVGSGGDSRDLSPLLGAGGGPRDPGDSPGVPSVEPYAPSVHRVGLGGPTASRAADGSSGGAGSPGPAEGSVPLGGSPVSGDDALPGSGTHGAAVVPVLGDRPGSLPVGAASGVASSTRAGSGASGDGPVVQRRAEGVPGPATRRAGLGAPLASLPPTPGTPASGTVADPRGAVRGSGMPAMFDAPGLASEPMGVAPLLGDRSSPSIVVADPSSPGSPGDGAGERESSPEAPTPAVQRRVTSDADPAPSSAPTASVVEVIEPAGSSLRTASDGPVTAPLLGERPVASSLRPTSAGNEVQPAAVASSVVPGSAGGVLPSGVSASGRPSLQRTVQADAPIARRSAVSVDWRGGSTSARLDAGSWVDAGAAAVASGVAQRHADGSVVFDAPADPEPADDEPVQREAAGSGGGAAPTGGGSGASGGAAAASGAELDELAKRLYGRMRLLLKQELRHDRERAGSLTRTRR